MELTNIRRSLARAAFALAAGLCVPQAAAVVYSSAFDPPNFSGTATFDVSQGCLDVGTGFANPSTLAGCDVTWLGATVTFQDAPTLTFDYTAFLPDAGAVSMIWVENGELAGVISAAIGPVEISGNANPLFNGPWWIQFAFAPQSVDDVLDGPPSSGAFGLGVVYLYTGICSSRDQECVRNGNPVETADVEYFRRVTQVPEPGTLVLMLGALGGAWLARRRSTLRR